MPSAFLVPPSSYGLVKRPFLALRPGPVPPGDPSNRTVPRGKWYTEPSWSPDGQTIAFWSPSDCNIFLANADGSGTPKQLPTPGFSGCAARPEWSPEGGRIAFEGHGEDSGINIYVMDVSPEGYTSGLRQLTDNRFFYEKPAWSPDGAEIAFVSNRTYEWEIYKIDVRSLRVTRLTHSPLIWIPNRPGRQTASR